MKPISLTTNAVTVNDVLLVRLPASVSKHFPSRGMCMATARVRDTILHLPLEPDGAKSHWFEITAALNKTLKLKDGSAVKLDIEPAEEWIDPTIPNDIKSAIVTNETYAPMWDEVTTKARWEWVRWIRSTNSEATRAKRIAVAQDKLKKGERRPCCFNASQCTDMRVCKHGVLIGAT